MAWEENLQEASFRGVVFEVQNTRDQAPRALVSHEYPFVDGEEIEDHGRKGRRVTMTAVLWGEDYDIRLQAFLKALDEPGTGTLVHPVFGVMPTMQSEGYDVAHGAENPDYCTVSLSFRQSTTGAAFFSETLKQHQIIATDKAAVIQNLAAANHKKKVDELAALKGILSRLNNFRDLCNQSLGKIAALANQTKNIAVDLITYPLSFASDIVGLLSDIADLRTFDKTILIADWKSLVADIKTIVKLPAHIAAESTHADDIALVSALVTTSAAAQLVATAATLLDSEANDPTLSPAEIERMVIDVREMTVAAIALIRTHFDLETGREIIEALKDAAAAIQDAARDVIDLKPPYIQRTVEAAGNLRLIAHRWYGDHTRADELARLNPQIRNPNLITAGEVLNAYAQ